MGRRREGLLEDVETEASFIQRDRPKLSPYRTEDPQRLGIGWRLDDDSVTPLEEGLGREVDPPSASGEDEDLRWARPHPAQLGGLRQPSPELGIALRGSTPQWGVALLLDFAQSLPHRVEWEKVRRRVAPSEVERLLIRREARRGRPREQGRNPLRVQVIPEKRLVYRMGCFALPAGKGDHGPSSRPPLHQPFAPQPTVGADHGRSVDAERLSQLVRRGKAALGRKGAGEDQFPDLVTDLDVQGNLRVPIELEQHSSSSCRGPS